MTEKGAADWWASQLRHIKQTLQWEVQKTLP